ncbi:hypothetical protein T492DRAFT_311534 [Pavlovales sp. CCMP2436]|nr:hypothetical protein T492DRAFT_311534 [Pavlovales sp. CCMP2436]
MRVQMQPHLVFLQEVQLRAKGGEPAASDVRGDHSRLFAEALRAAGFAVYLPEQTVESRSDGRDRRPAAMSVLTAWAKSRLRLAEGEGALRAVEMGGFSHKSAAVVALVELRSNLRINTANVHLSVPLGKGGMQDDRQQLRELEAAITCLRATALATHSVDKKPTTSNAGPGAALSSRLAEAAGAVTLLAGDLNALPASAAYRQLCAQGMTSAYAAALRAEPEYTTINEAFGFVGTVDYIFASPGMRVKRVLGLRSPRPQALPSAACPSDHEPLAADFELWCTRAESANAGDRTPVSERRPAAAEGGAGMDKMGKRRKLGGCSEPGSECDCQTHAPPR